MSFVELVKDSKVVIQKDGVDL